MQRWPASPSRWRLQDNAEIERLKAAIAEASISIETDRRELEIAEAKLNNNEEAKDPDTSMLESLRSRVATSRALEVEARLKLRTEEERVAAITRRASDLENAAKTEREAASRSISRREARARGAVTAQAILELLPNADVLKILEANARARRLQSVPKFVNLRAS
jgi:chromosome segregation protein